MPTAVRLGFALALMMAVPGVASTWSPRFLQAQAPAARAPRNATEFDALFQQVKNWGAGGLTTSSVPPTW